MARILNGNPVAFVSDIARFIRVEPDDILRMIKSDVLPASEIPTPKRTVMRIPLNDLHVWLNRPRSPNRLECWPDYEKFIEDFASATKTRLPQALNLRAVALGSEVARFFSVDPKNLNYLAGWKDLPALRLRMRKNLVTRIPLREFHEWLQTSFSGWAPISNPRHRRQQTLVRRLEIPPRNPSPVNPDFEEFLNDFASTQKRG